MTPSSNKFRQYYSELILVSILFLFFLQLVTDLIQVIYSLALLNLHPDEKILGLFFLLSSFILLFFKKKVPDRAIQLFGIMVLICRILSPLVDTATKIITSGLGVGFFLMFLPALILRKKTGEEGQGGLLLGTGLAMATGTSILFRTLNSTVDISTRGCFQAIGWALAGIAAVMLLSLPARADPPDAAEERKASTESLPEGGPKKKKKAKKAKKARQWQITALICGLFSVIILIYFAFDSPTTFSRWTDGNYLAITTLVSLMILVFVIGAIAKPGLIRNVKPRVAWAWNLLFVGSLVLSIVVHVVPFSSDPNSLPIVAPTTTWVHYVPLYAMIVLSPIIFIDLVIFSSQLIKRVPSRTQIAKGFTFGGLYFIVMCFILIFTNVWGYLGVSYVFRNLFWLPFLMVGAGLIFPFLQVKEHTIKLAKARKNFKSMVGTATITCLIFTGTLIGAFATFARPIALSGEGVHSLTIMTYNIQQGVNATGELSYDEQLALIRAINPDVIGLQESDTSRISGGNMDVVRYFADKLNYYSYYGPKTITGTFGTAILSRYPLENATTFFTYSDIDEVGTAQAQISLGSKVFTIFNSHPAGSDLAKLAHATGLMARVNESLASSDLISMGDFNSKENSTSYNYSTIVLNDSWLERWATGVDDDGLNMSERIDHIFVSPGITVTNATYILSPESQTDHPAYWIKIAF